MELSIEKIKVLLGVAIFMFIGYVIWVSVFGIKEVDPELQREAEANSPECNYEKGKTELDDSRIYTEKEVDESAAIARACIEAKIKYIKAKEASEN